MTSAYATRSQVMILCIHIYIYIYSSLSDVISNMNYKYMEDHMFVIYDTVSMGNWFFTFQGNEDVSSSVVDLRRFDQNRK